MNAPSQVALVRRLEKSTLYFNQHTSRYTPEQLIIESQSPEHFTAANLVAWVNSNRGLVLHELDDTNLFDPEVHDPSKYQLVAVGDRSSPLGLYFHKILFKTIQNISRENEREQYPRTVVEAEAIPATTPLPLPQPINLDDIEVVWLDLQKYPSALTKISSLAGNVNNPNKVWFGLIQSPVIDTPTQWFDLSTLNTTASDKKSDDDNIHVLRQWILSVTNRPVAETVAPTLDVTTTEPSFLLEPEPVNARQGSSFVLDCKVSDKIGDCVWTKNNQEVPVVGPYSWSGQQQDGDCALMVKQADPVRDTGLWSCQMKTPTGSIAIQSKSVPVNVRLADVEL